MMLGNEALVKLISDYEFQTVLDIGSGEGAHAQVFRQFGKTVTTCDLGRSPYYEQRPAGAEASRQGDYLAMRFPEPFDCIWCCHVLEHQRNVGLFLEKVFDDLADGGVLAVTVPPRKGEIVGGHLTLWNAGLLLYNLILAGFDCRDAAVKQYDYNISVIVEKRRAALEEVDLACDLGDIEKLARWFPFEAVQGFDGDLREINWSPAVPIRSERSRAAVPAS